MKDKKVQHWNTLTILQGFSGWNVFSSKLIDLKSEKKYNNAILIVLPDF